MTIPRHWTPITDWPTFQARLIARAAYARLLPVRQVAEALDCLPVMISRWAKNGFIRSRRMRPDRTGGRQYGRTEARILLHVDIKDARRFHALPRAVRRQMYRDAREWRKTR